MFMKTLYTVAKIKKAALSDTSSYVEDKNLEKLRHGSDYGEITICGLEINSDWYIINNTFDGKITCKKCLNLIKKYPIIGLRHKAKEYDKV